MILQDDALYILLSLPFFLNSPKIVQKISYFFVGYYLATATWCILVIIINDQWYIFLTQYMALMSGGIFLFFSNYVTMYWPSAVEDFYNILDDMPLLCPLRSAGPEEFQHFQKLAKVTKRFLIIVAVSLLVVAIAALPWNENHYDLVFPVKVAMDYLDGAVLHIYLIILYLAFYHFALTLLANLVSLIYMLLHAYMQFHMLNAKLRNLTDGNNSDSENNIEEELISCIKHHQTLLRFAKKLKEFLYYPLFYYTASGVIVGISLILVQKSLLSKQDVFVVRCIGLTTVGVTAAFCSLGQLVENESNELPNSAYDTPWYLCSIKNRKHLLIFITRAQNNVVFSSSGIITMNNQLAIGLFRAIYSVLMFLIKISSTRK